MAQPRNLANLSHAAKAFGTRTVLEDVSLGVADGERIGVVGRNGDGKSTLLALITGQVAPDTGAATRTRELTVSRLTQGDELGTERTARTALVGDRPEHAWAADPAVRAVLDGLLGGVGFTRLPAGPDTVLDGLSGGERRRIALARALIEPAELLVLDEPTNHLDVEAIDWLAGHVGRRSGALLVVTHDRWFLDAVCSATWEVSDGTVHAYEGGYAAYVLARAERDRQAQAREERRRQLVRKELAWLRRGPPARTSKPKFRIEAANALIADVPEVRDRAALERFATQRLGTKVLEAEQVVRRLGDRPVLDGLTWRLGPGDRVAVMGANGAGKTTLLRLLAGETEPDAGTVERGPTVQVAFLSQTDTVPPSDLRVLESLEEVRRRATLADGRELTAGSLAERFGFRGDRGRAFVRDLSGGERRRLALMRLMMAGPNVLLLDEPTNDLDVETLTALEDLLDGWPGTLVVASHDRYFVERVTDDVYALLGDGGITHLPGGVPQYLSLVRAADATPVPVPVPVPVPRTTGAGAAAYAARKEIRRLEAALSRLEQREADLHAAMAESATDHARLTELQGKLAALAREREEAETRWLELAETSGA